MLTRRRILALLPPALAGMTGRLQAQLFFSKKPKAANTPVLVYVGTDTARPGAKGLYSARFDMATGKLTTPALAAESSRPAFMAENRELAKRLMYVCNEGDEKTSTISSYAVDMSSGALKLLGQVSAGAAGPCYVAVDATGKSAYVADYMGGVVTSYRVQPDGQLAGPVSRIDFHLKSTFGDAGAEPGPQKDRQDGPHPHSATISPDNRFLIVNDLGQDLIAIFPIDAETAKLSPATIVDVKIAASGPRHVAFHPNGRWVYGINELANRIDLYLWNETQGTATVPAQAILTDAGMPVRTLDPNFTAKDTAAEICVDPSGNFVYASNRGEDTLVVFAVDEQTGALTFVQRIGCGGKAPRHFTLDPSGRWLLCGNQDSATLTVFARNRGSGRLAGPVQTVPIESPMYTLFME
jgi:6-phosphogluconolactonase